MLIFSIVNDAEIPFCLNASVATRSRAVSVDGAAINQDLGVHRWGRTGVHHFLCGNWENCHTGTAIAGLVSRFAPWDASESQSFARWREE